MEMLIGTVLAVIFVIPASLLRLELWRAVRSERLQTQRILAQLAALERDRINNDPRVIAQRAQMRGDRNRAWLWASVTISTIAGFVRVTKWLGVI
jgi:hypothetical protein